jgi:hypothetical protein
MNRKYTGDLKDLWSVLLYRRKTQGVTPGMTGKAVNDKKEENIDLQWIFPKRQPTDKQKRQIISRVCEIGVRIVFEHFTYQFGGDTFIQMVGGPIGARVMAAARLVMQSWSEDYLAILIASQVLVDMLTGYVDDGRQGSFVLPIGMRYEKESNKFEFSEEARKEDLQLDENNNKRMARICLPAMNSVNEDLIFTTEIPEDFPLARLPTLDFLIWLVNGLINHTYFEKEMKTPFLTMQRSAMGEQQRSSILSNELVRPCPTSTTAT